MKLAEGPSLSPGLAEGELGRAWKELLECSATASAFLSPEWLLPWWQVYGPTQGRQPWIFTYWRGGRLIGFAPLSLRTHYPRYQIPLRRWEIWGSGEAEADAVCSDYLNVLALPGAEADVAAGLEHCLRTSPLGHELVIPLMDMSSQQTLALQQAFLARGWWMQIEQPTESRWIELPTSWEAYLAARKASSRYWIRRTLRDLQQWAGSTLLVREAQRPEELPFLQEHLIRLHQERWQGTSGGTFRSRLFLAFHRRIQEQWLARGQLQLAVLWGHAQPIAAVYNLYWRDQVLFYQCGRSLQVPRGLRPGAWILAWSVQQAIARRFRRFDFLGGVASYKAQFASEVRRLAQVRFQRPGIRTAVQRLIEHAKQTRRVWLAGCPGWSSSVENTVDEPPESDQNSGANRIR
ncbi:MAG: GNAT family N-acetyltransferase [Gemmataceae bacterium]